MGARENGEERDDRSSDVDQDGKQGKEVESDYEPGRDSLSSQGSNEDTKVKRVSRVPKKLEKKDSKENSPRMIKSSANRQTHSKLQYISSNNSRSLKPNKAGNTVKTVEVRKPQTVKVPSRPSSEVSEETDDKAIEGRAIDGKAIEGRNIEDKAKEEAKEIDVLDEAPNCDQSTGTDDEIADTEGNVVDDDKSIAYEKTQQLESKIAYEKTQELESKIDKLEQELREVAALEVSLYSVAPEHGSSSHKLHTPARHLSRLYIHASKFWSSDKRASVAKSTISGLVLVAKSCGNDVSRLAFWLSNTVVLREIIAQTFGTSLQMSLVLKAFNTNGNAKKHDGKSMPTRWKNSSNGKQTKLAAMPLPDDWQETGTLLAALEKIESWIFSRIVESVWWQVLTPHMQTLVEDLSTPKAGRLSGPALGDQQQGTFSINLWKSAFHDAFSRICPPRAGGHDCGCLSVLAKLVMKQCVARLDVAMFNAILRESANEMPTDPISDPIVDSKVLPIPAGDLSFGSGAQLKNSIGNWSRWLTDIFGMNADDSDKDGQDALNDEDDDRRDAAESTSFQLLNELSDLLMLPKDMLLEKSIRKEVCPSIGLTLVTRVLCNFTPDEFCPDPVPGMVLEELNSESLLEHFTEKDVISTFPCTAAPAVYCAPLLPDAAEKVADTGGNAELDRRASTVQRRGHTSDDNLDDLGCPLASLIDRSFPPSPSNDTAHFITQKGASMANERYELLREVWSERP